LEPKRVDAGRTDWDRTGSVFPIVRADRRLASYRVPMKRLIVSAVFPLLTSLLVGACGTTAVEPEPEAVSSVAPADEAPVVEGLNKRFLDPALDPEDFVRVFEGESREIAALRLEISSALEIGPGMTVADVGAGTGLFVLPFAEAVGDEGKLYAVDIAPRLVDYMRERVSEAGLEQVEVVLCDERSVQLPANSVDLVFVCDTYHHFTYPRSTLYSIHTALKQGGHLVVLDFERIPGVSSEWILGHVRAGKEAFREEIEAAGFRFDAEIESVPLEDNYILRFVAK
jgi:ubiquinone/menaquinone biosynthesis C-methylase UbiE